MSQPTPTRPRQVTLAAWLIMAGSVIVVAMVFERVGGLHTLETRESVEKFLAEPPGADLGIGIDRAIAVLRIASMVAGGCATAAAILGYHLLQRSRSARLALTVLAVPLFLTGMVTGGFMSSVVAAAALMLWLQPARDWFDGVAPAPAPDPKAADGPLPAAAGAEPVRGRPTAVVWACVLTWACSAMTALALGVTGVLLALDPDVLLEEAHRQNPDLAAQGVSDDLLIGVVIAMLVGAILWCVAAMVLAALVYRRRDGARIALVVSAGLAAVVSLVGTVLGGYLLALSLVAAVATIALLVRSDVRPWFRRSP